LIDVLQVLVNLLRQYSEEEEEEEEAQIREEYRLS
jgi:hypothetical protein